VPRRSLRPCRHRLLGRPTATIGSVATILSREPEVERQRDERIRHEAESERARLTACPIVELARGLRYWEHPDDEDLLINVETGTVVDRQRSMPTSAAGPPTSR
jgi:hypothetical protein